MTRSFLAAAFVPLLLAGSAADVARAPEAVTPNDNMRTVGTMRSGALTVALEARTGEWRPEGPTGRALEVAAFAEEGKPLTTPGPMIRTTVGTAVRITFRNKLTRGLTIFGVAKPRDKDSVVVAPNATGTLSFTPQAAGTFYYIARSGTDPFGGRLPEDTQLQGVVIVDPAGTTNPPPERVMAISWYFTVNFKSKSGLGHGTMAINGLSWPHTEKMNYSQGDSIRWRVVNFTEADHPMHLHGFYFRVNSKGDGVTDSVYNMSQRRMAVTEIVAPAQTMTLSWQADRPGNWIYHCHYAGHISHLASLDTEDGEVNESKHAAHNSDRPHQMFGLVVGITIAPKGTLAASSEAPRKIRILQRQKPNVYGKQPGMSFVVDGTPEARDPNALSIPGPTLVLERGKPVAVTIVNQSNDHATIHWHGIELESYPDGVPGWSGSGTNVLPSIKPHDSLTVRWTPPRTGSFMYHSHFNESQQMGRGLYGPIVVVEPGQKYDPEIDKTLFFGTAGDVENVILGPFPNVVLNGKKQPDAMNLKVGTKYRFRLFNLAGDLPTMVAMEQGGKPIMWRAVAKDGYPLPGPQAISKPAMLVFDPGEIYDFEYTPTAAGQLALKFGIPPFLIPPPPPPPKPGDPPPLPAPQLPPTITVTVNVR